MLVLGHPPIAGQPALALGDLPPPGMHQYGAFWSRRPPAPHKLTPVPSLSSVVFVRQVQAVKPELGAKRESKTQKGRRGRRSREEAAVNLQARPQDLAPHLKCICCISSLDSVPGSRGPEGAGVEMHICSELIQQGTIRAFPD